MTLNRKNIETISGRGPSQSGYPHWGYRYIGPTGNVHLCYISEGSLVFALGFALATFWSNTPHQAHLSQMRALVTHSETDTPVQTESEVKILLK